MKPESESPPSDEAHAAPPRSRNARAQARHRAKRKAYIEQLEETVSRLQATLANPDQGGSRSVSQARLHELEQENIRLRQEIDYLKSQIVMSPLEPTRRTSLPYPVHEDHDAARTIEPKRRRMSAEADASFLAPSHNVPSNGSHGFRSVPMLSVPHMPSAHSSAHHMTAANSTTSNVPPTYAMNSLYQFGNYPMQPSSGSSGSSAYSASPLSPLPELVSPLRRKGENFRDPSNVIPSSQASHASGVPAFDHSATRYPSTLGSPKRPESGEYLHAYQDSFPSFFPPSDGEISPYSRHNASKAGS